MVGRSLDCWIKKQASLLGLPLIYERNKLCVIGPLMLNAFLKKIFQLDVKTLFS